MSALPVFSIDKLSAALEHGIRIALILSTTFVVVRLINRWVPKMRRRIVDSMRRHGDATNGELEKRATTLGSIFR
ncbi:MAG: hypothetical protein ABFD60_04935, partial [Bryobacteraceae bacterium]